ncbi:pyridoxamine 5'-phosphate oxidase family protein [Nocardia sp. CDC159]|uniref:Pyridoxamine 5'-phosphate oxidase family protein n=1 Tax=Nocardia pulmonis TaxID=2951408 RepID=A0A9X2IWP2_9NOCA|nr:MULTISPECIES: pyridoxamine 5'-phosphate oxidase family protein [Nocardia]MCM6775132.1 pyridoxamine 5'-phosphate oxidase family protein [Nocardia pulmonis]MCM6789602.1 pyridoxamine 5'-phosphate oxidase family protein [Nocardia sp. CDC159]
MTESVSARPSLSPTSRSTLTRYRDRAAIDRAALDAVLDAGLLCHVGVVMHGSPVVLPTIYGRHGDTLYLHGSTGAGNLRAALTGEVSVAVTLLDGIVYARSAMNFSMNYRSAVIHGRPTEVTDPDERLRALRVITDHNAPGAWDVVRPPNKKELAATRVLALDLTEASVKSRAGDSGDDPEDLDNGVWAGVLPIRQIFGTPRSNGDLAPGIDIPEYVHARVTQAPVDA